MDCEIFDRLVVDRIFSELDDLNSGAVQRHVAHCSRCRSIESSLRATREVATLPSLEPDPSFVEQVLVLERATRTKLPLRQRVERTVSVMAGYAMRPQLAMSALLLLMIGSSLFLLRVHPGERELVQVTERGVPEGDVEVRPTAARGIDGSPPLASAAQREMPPTRPDTSSASDIAPASEALVAARAAFGQERYEEAYNLAEASIRQGGSDTGNAALLAALSLSKISGCASALARFEALRARHGKSAIGEEAAYRAAECHADLGTIERARTLFEQLRSSATWGSRARSRLGQLPAPPRDPSDGPDAGDAPATP